MIRWFIVIFLALMFISWFTPLLNKLGFGKLPGDLRFKLFGRDWYVPITGDRLRSMSILGRLVKSIAYVHSMARDFWIGDSCWHGGAGKHR